MHIFLRIPKQILPSSSACLIYSIKTFKNFGWKYHADVESAINIQIQAEQQAAQNYLGMAVLFLHPCMSRPGAGGFFMKMYEEEIGHMKQFIHYQLVRGGMPVINNINASVANTDLTLHGAFVKALEMEKNIAEMLENVVTVAEKVKDRQCADFVTTVFLKEQMLSVSDLSHHVTKLSRLCNEHATYHYDLELAKLYPYSYNTVG